ncbi:hypothetical protein JAAARDRAFT_190924 [Jaapia argillacea MUCL 33604]|uniref:Nucleoporin Nup133/Nup155-like C-terminal domain-containing protein n=1 Tax=Jaapia argillacea MUCL 33604 TaxID=933084 RepID=A0A067Q130_9AGAM|nr:hypothetical protein JAAARDRAFT_190924 [Jaapia argillacea MUCL 33604]
MASFSPAPRRSSRLTANRPAGQSPTAAPGRRSRAGSSRATSRRVTPARALAQDRRPSIQDDISMASGMDVDERTPAPVERVKLDTVFAKSHELSIHFYANLPAEVKQVLKSADFFRDAYTGDIDTLTGFALVSTIQTCFVWQHAQALTGIPTCYIFSCPLDATQATAPFHALVPFGTVREPGLILVSPGGEVRFWDSIAMGLAGGEHYNATLLELDSGESVTTLTRSDAFTYVVSTSTGRLLRLTVTSSGGKYHLAFHVFSRPQSSLSLTRFLPSLWSTPTVETEGGYVSSVALGEGNTLSRDVWALVETRVQKWNMTTEGWEEIVMDEEIAEIIRPAIRAAFPAFSPGNDSDLDLELLDLAVEKSGALVVLVSYAGIEDDSAMDIEMHPRRIYAIVRLSNYSGIFKVDQVHGVPYQSTSSSGAPMHPRMKLISGGTLVGIQFGDAVTLTSRDTNYQDRLELKSATDRTLGVGITEAENEVLVMTAATMMKVTVDLDAVSEFDPENGGANIIKSIMTQAILYGSYPENPLHFSFPPDVDEDSLMSGAEQLSQAILESDADVVRPNVDLGAQMTGRKERLSFLIKFINENAVLSKVSQRSRQRLVMDAEKLYAAHQLWLRHNEFLSTGQSHSILNEAVYTYMNEVDEGHHEDFMRAFFRLKVADLGRLMSHVMNITRRSSYEMNRRLSDALPEANRVVLTVLRSAMDYRQYNLSVYGVELPLYKPWTSKPKMVDVVLELFEATTKMIESPTPEMNSDANLTEPKGHLCDLASVLFACMRERLDWLGCSVATAEPGTERERQELDDKFRQLRPEILDTLRRNGHAEHAFKLAEQYRDFRTLASLCHKGRVYPPEENPNSLRIQSYIERFKEEFTTELYRWYIEHGELRTMFAQEDSYGAYMNAFFEKYPNRDIAWIHDLGKGRFGLASQLLLSEAKSAPWLETKQLMFSIGKLAHLAQLHENEASIDEAVLDSFHDGLDFVSVHQALLLEFRAALTSSSRSKQSLDAQVETMAKAHASNLHDRRALLKVFKQLVRRLLQGRSLSIEDSADVLSLKDNKKGVADYATALHLLSRDDQLPEARKMGGFRSVWRRIYLHDDWNRIRQTAGVTDAELNEKLRATALYAALETTLSKRRQPKGYILQPHECLEIPTMSEIVSRWPGMAPDQMESLENDYAHERNLVSNLGLAEVYERVRELVEQDPVWGTR